MLNKVIVPQAFFSGRRLGQQKDLSAKGAEVFGRDVHPDIGQHLVGRRDYRHLAELIDRDQAPASVARFPAVIVHPHLVAMRDHLQRVVEIAGRHYDSRREPRRRLDLGYRKQAGGNALRLGVIRPGRDRRRT